jgi:hypothetical protein
LQFADVGAAGTAERLPDAYAALSTLMRDTEVSDLDDAALVVLDERITRVHDDLATKRNVVKSELTRRRCAEAVAGVMPDFVCSISHVIMSDPVMAADGNSYERRQIARWFDDGHRTSPLTGARCEPFVGSQSEPPEGDRAGDGGGDGSRCEWKRGGRGGGG